MYHVVCEFGLFYPFFLCYFFFPFVIREKRKLQSWLPVLEKHDIPIVLGVGVSLAFILITMAFYSLLQKNDPAAKPGRAGKTSNLRKIINT